MTKKEKKDLALKIKAETEARKPKAEKPEIISKEQLEKNNHKRNLLQKARNRKHAKEAIGSKYPKQRDSWKEW